MKKIIGIVFHGENPFSVITDDGSIFDVELCHADETLYFSKSGNYGLDGDKVFLDVADDTNYWLADGYSPKFNPGAGPGNKLPDVDPKWLDMDEWGVESDTVYCLICNDHLPTDDVEIVCDHIEWDTEKGWWAGPGCDC